MIDWFNQPNKIKLLDIHYVFGASHSKYKLHKWRPHGLWALGGIRLQSIMDKKKAKINLQQNLAWVDKHTLKPS